MIYVVTIGGKGERLKPLSPKDKHLLYYKNKRIIEWIEQETPSVRIIGESKTKNRKETLQEIQTLEDVFIIDCDIIPFGIKDMVFTKDTVVCFHSEKPKYGSVVVVNGKVIRTDESNSISKVKCSGVYFVKSVKKLLEKMQEPNSIVSGMLGADVFIEKTFLRMGDVEDYMEAI